MTHQEIKELAGHRAVSPWIMKLVADAVAKEREQCAQLAEDLFLSDGAWIAKAIRDRNKK